MEKLIFRHRRIPIHNKPSSQWAGRAFVPLQYDKDDINVLEQLEIEKDKKEDGEGHPETGESILQGERINDGEDDNEKH